MTIHVKDGKAVIGPTIETHAYYEREARIDAIATILEESGLSYVESRYAAKRIVALPRNILPPMYINVKMHPDYPR